MAKTAIITGATGKLGSSISLALANDGYDCVCLYGKNKDKASLLEGRIETEFGRRAVMLALDLAMDNFFDVNKKLYNAIFELGNKELVLVNSASLFIKDKYADMILQMEKLNVQAPFRITKYIASLEDFNLDSVVNITDAGANLIWPSYKKYCHSKAMLNMQTVEMAIELAPKTRVNAVAPGLIDSEGLAEDEFANLLAKIPMGRQGLHSNVVEAVMFMIGNSYVTGQIIAVDGGRSIIN